MRAPALRRMTADEFIAWAMEQPEGRRYELVDGEIVAMSPERAGHSRAKAAAWSALRSAIAAAGLPCEAFPDGMSVRIDDRTVYEPDALVRCGEPLDDEAVELNDPVIVIEVLSPSSRGHDVGAKLVDYFRLPSVQHYLVISTRRRVVVDHGRTKSGTIETRILKDGELRLEPPGLELRVADLFS
jgi:Uma2 family endonuclease